MRRLDRGPSRRERRAAQKNMPRGRRSTHLVETTYGRGQLERDRLAAWQAMREIERATA